METGNNQSIKDKSEILFLYEGTYTIPNGDPFTGEQRYDEETKKVLVSDVRIKRYIRDYILTLNDHLPQEKRNEIYVWNDISQAEGKESGSSARMKALKKSYENDSSVKKRDKKGNETNAIDASKLLRKCIDVRLFGGISTEEGDAVNHTGPVQFALLNPSMNEVDLRMHQNTSVFVSSVEKSRGAIGTTTVVPYCINQIHGWINPHSAKFTNLTEQDINLMFKSLWESINNINTRSKANQNSLLLVQIIYSDPTKKIYGLDRLIKMTPKNDLRGEQIRSIDDVEFDFSKLMDAAKSDAVAKVRYFTEIEGLKKGLQEKTPDGKLVKMDFDPNSLNS